MSINYVRINEAKNGSTGLTIIPTRVNIMLYIFNNKTFGYKYFVEKESIYLNYQTEKKKN